MKFVVALVTSIVLCIVGVALVIIGKRNEVKTYKELVATIVDAGGSGTRLNVYKFSRDFNTIKQETIKCESKGLGNYQKSEFPELEEKLKECYGKGHAFLPKGAKTPIWFSATAGMRLLRLRDKQRYNKVWTLVNDTLKTTNYDVKSSDTIPGELEARFAWLAANILKKSLTTDHKVGVVETGSSSIQIAFLVDEASDKDKHVHNVDIDGKNTKLYEYSYLCYGEAEMIRRLHAQIVTDSNFAAKNEDPCSNPGYIWTRSSDYLWSEPCVKGDYAKKHFKNELLGPGGNATTYQITGTGKPQQCLDLWSKMIQTSCTKHKPCAMDDVFQPIVRGKYLALSVFFYSTKYMGLPYNGKMGEYWKKTQDLCQTPYDKLSPKYPNDPEKYKSTRCIQSVFTYFLLDEGFKFDNNTWDIEYTDKINGNGVQWTLGLAYESRDQAYVNVIKTKVKLYTLLFLSGLVVIVVAVFMAMISIVCHKKDTLSKDTTKAEYHSVENIEA